MIRSLTVHPAKRSWAFTGLGRTLDPLKHGRIWQLFYAEGIRGRASQCRPCAAIFSEGREYCLYCGSLLEAHGVRVRTLGPDAATALTTAGGNGASLRSTKSGQKVLFVHFERHGRKEILRVG